MSPAETPAGYPNKKSAVDDAPRLLFLSPQTPYNTKRPLPAGERELQLKRLTRPVHLYSDSLVSEELSFNVGYAVVEITRLTSPEVRAAVQACAQPPVLILTQEEKRSGGSARRVPMDKIKAWSVINHDYKYCLALVLWMGHLRESQNWTFLTILCPGIPRRYKTSRAGKNAEE